MDHRLGCMIPMRKALCLSPLEINCCGYPCCFEPVLVFFARFHDIFRVHKRGAWRATVRRIVEAKKRSLCQERRNLTGRLEAGLEEISGFERCSTSFVNRIFAWPRLRDDENSRTGSWRLK